MLRFRATGFELCILRPTDHRVVLVLCAPSNSVEIAEVQVWMDGRVECTVMRRSGGGRGIAEVEMWMAGRVEGRVLRRSGGGREVAEVEVWMDGRMECVVLRRSRSKWRRQRGDGVEEEVNGGDGVHHQTANREWGGRFAVPRSTVSTMRHAPLKF